MSDNFGLIQQVGNDDYLGRVVEGYSESGEKFSRAPAYYIASGVGEIPYWLIGVGEAKAALTATTKTAAFAAKTVAATGKLPSPRKMQHFLVIERANTKLDKAVLKTKTQIASEKNTSGKFNIRRLETALD
jgi:hypothetical protein